MVHKLRQYFLAGIVLVTPIAITVYILVAVFRFTDGLLGKYLNFYIKANLGYSIPGLGLLLFLIIILIAGFFAKNFLGKKIMHLLEGWFLKLPFVSRIYPHVKQFIDLVVAKEKPSFKKVVLIEYPRKGIFSLGFITNESMSEVEEKTREKVVTVLIPSIPNPFSGFFVFCKKEELIYLDITVEEGIKQVVSGGVLQPEKK